MRSFHQIYRRWGLKVLLLCLAVLCVLAAIGLVGSFNAAFRNQDAFASLIDEAALRHGVQPELIRAVIKRESRFFPWRVGDAGEIGLMQITEGAVRDWERVTGNQCSYRGMLFDPRLNIEIGTWYLARSLQRWDGDPMADALALAEYNAGYGNVRDWVRQGEVDDTLRWVRFRGTREYIRAVCKYRDEFMRGRVTRE